MNKAHEFHENHKNKQVNNWLILDVPLIKKSNSSYAKCSCVCGKIKEVNIYNILDGQSLSCGCIHRENRTQKLKIWIKENGSPRKTPKGQAAFNVLYGSYKWSAKTKNKEFKLTKEEFRSIISRDCHYCGEKPSLETHYKQYNGNIIYNGIDRKNNDLGYTLENSLPCCTICNYLKKDRNYLDFISHINKISINLSLEQNCQNPEETITEIQENKNLSEKTIA